MSLDLSSRARLAPGAKANFPTESLFDRIARVVCDAHCLPRKELFLNRGKLRGAFAGGFVEVGWSISHAATASSPT